jgi:isochorismate pyruvate lyase
MAARAREVNLDRRLSAARKAAMTSSRVSPAQCRTMAEVRHGVDRLDEEIVALLGERFRYMDAAARIKPSRDRVRDEARKAEVIANARRAGLSEGVDPTLLESLYEQLVEASIGHELARFDALRDGSSAG